MNGKESQPSIVYTQIFSRMLSGFLAVALAIPNTAPLYAGEFSNLNAANISKGDTASALPEVKKICDAVRSSQDGSFATKAGTFMGVKEKCSGFTRRQQNTEDCQEDLSQGVKGLKGEELQAKIDSLCTDTKMKGDSAVYCALRHATKGGQALQYCNAYDSADKAQSGLKKTLYFDIAAAGACFTDYIAIKMAEKSGGTYKGVACGGAAMAASLMELVQTVSVLGKTKNTYTDGSSRDHSAGGYKIDSSNRVVNRGGLAKALEITASTTLSASAFMIGVCYYQKTKEGLCSQFSSIKSPSAARVNAVDKANTAVDKASLATVSVNCRQKGQVMQLVGYPSFTCPGTGPYRIVPDAGGNKEVTTAINKANRTSEQDANAALAMRAALIFTALAGMRGIASGTAGKTKRQAEEILQSLFTSTGATTAMGGGTGGGASNSSIFTASNSTSFNNPTVDKSNKSAVTAADPTDSAFLAPPGSALNDRAGIVGAKVQSSMNDGDMGTAGGLSAGIAAAATAAGAPASAIDEIRGHVNSIFANLPAEDGGYAGGGGKMASKGDSGGGDGLNLKGLFGDGAKEEQAAASEDLAYRSLASDDIWHSKNPKGNNLFQIISDRYDTAQRNRGF